MAQAQETKPIGVIGIMGRNGSDPSFLIPDRQCLDAVNIDWFRSSLGRKRGGSSSLSLTGGTAFSTGAVAIARHVPSFDQTAAEFWAIDGARAFHRLAGGTAWADPTVVDACSATPQEANFLSFNGKLYIAYKNAHNRLHAWDAVTASVRRCGLDLPGVATPGAPAGGAVTDTRQYRVSWTKQVSGVTTYRSNLSVATASVPLAAQQVTLTRAAAPGEGETHWELWAASTSSAFGDFRLLVTTVIATTTAVDNTATLPSTVAPADGANTPPPSCKYMVADDARIIMGGAYELAAGAENAMVPSPFRVWWTSIIGAGTGDDERVSNTGTINNYADLEEAITGISQPMQLISAAANSLERGSFYVFSYGSQWKFVSTGTANTPYLKFRVTGGRGCIHHKSIVTAEDDNGNPAIYWASQTGIMRISVFGQQFMSEDVVDLWARVNLDATIPCHAVFHSFLHQIWFFVALDGSLYPNTRLVFDTRLGKITDVSGVRQGWCQHTGEGAKAYCSTMFSDSVAASMGRSLKPYIGYSGGTAIWKCDTADRDDAGTVFQGYIDTKSYAPWGLGRVGGMTDEAILIAAAAPGVTVQVLVYQDEGAQTLTSSADLTPKSDSAAEVKVRVKCGGSRLGTSMSARFRIGDQAAQSQTWNLDALVIPVSYEGVG